MTQLQSLRLILLSSVGKALPSLTGVSFAELWEKSESGLPNQWPDDWGCNPLDLKMECMELCYLFHRVILNNLMLSSAADWNLDESAQVQVRAAAKAKVMEVVNGAVTGYETNQL